MEEKVEKVKKISPFINNDKNKMRCSMNKVLIGGKALLVLGSSRTTNDTDYLICDESKELFTNNSNVDYINAAKSEFFAEIWNAEKANQICSPEGLLELKAYAFVQHCQNCNWQKADDCEYDIRFLVRNFGVKSISRLAKYLASSEIKEITKIIESVKI